MKKEPEHVDDFRGDADLLFPSKYLKGVDLQGEDVTITIERVEKGAELVKVGGEVDRKPVIHLKGTEKMWVLNKTNMNSIAGHHGKKVAEWLGKKVTLYPAPWRGGGVCIRVR